MTGLEAILGQIEKEAASQAQALLDQARAEAQATLDSARKEAEERAGEILEEGRKKAASIRERGRSAALLEKRDALLRCKQGLIREALAQVCETLENAPAPEYFSTLLGLAARFGQMGSGVMYLNRRDLGRLPADFAKELKKAAPQGEILISPVPRDVESGFALEYGPVEMDCTFPALFRDAYDQLRDTAGAILFTQP